MVVLLAVVAAAGPAVNMKIGAGAVKGAAAGSGQEENNYLASAHSVPTAARSEPFREADAHSVA
jgi:hypothetical protein